MINIQPTWLFVWVLFITTLCLRYKHAQRFAFDHNLTTARTLIGKAILATSNNKLAAQLVGISTNMMMTISFGLSAAIGALAGVLVTPITLTSYDVGIALALKGFAAAILGGMGSPFGALLGGLLLGLIEAMTAGYISSTYKDAAAFIVILAVLFVMPNGIFGRSSIDRV